MLKLTVSGGHHSIGSLLTWLLIELDRHPTCYEKLMAEVRDVDPLNAGFLDAKTPYLDAILKEVNRLYPTVHATVRAVNREITLTTSKTPVILKPGMLVYLSYLHLHTSTRYWGANAKEFVPERFLEDDAVKNPAYMPFGAGPRSCVRKFHSTLSTVLTCVGRIQVRDARDQSLLGTTVANMYYRGAGKELRRSCPHVG